jgi:S-adenosylmethionine decarboxylase
MNRDHWLLYLTSPNAQPLLPTDSSLSSSFHLSLPTPGTPPSTNGHFDSTLEILMTHLAPAAREPFFIPEGTSGTEVGGHELGAKISKDLGIDTLFPASETRLDSFGFDPCGYSANGVVGSGSPHGSSTSSGGAGGGYYTIHVTPEEGWSYASFESNVPLPTKSSSAISSSTSSPSSGRPTLPTLIKKVVSIFQPSRLSITLFVSTTPSAELGEAENNWTAFGKDQLEIDGYDRKDRIGYEFDGYDLVFACFEKTGWVEERDVSIGGRQEESVKLLDRLSLEE